MADQVKQGGGGCGMLAIGVLLAALGLIIVIVVAPAPPVQGALTAVDSARSALGGDSVGGGGPSDFVYDATCPRNAPFRCDDGTCVLTPSMCNPAGECPPGAVMCADGSCVLDEAACPGTPEDHALAVEYFEATFRPDLVASIDPDLLAQAQQQADTAGPDDLAEPLVEACWRPGSGGACSAPGYCCCNICIYVPGYGDQCTDTICFYRPSGNPVPPPPDAACPENAPILCADGRCVATQGACGVPDVAVPDVSGCPADTPFMCEDGTCVATPSACPQPPPAEEAAPEEPSGQDGEPEACGPRQFQCPDGSCVAARLDCP